MLKNYFTAGGNYLLIHFISLQNKSRNGGTYIQGTHLVPRQVSLNRDCKQEFVNSQLTKIYKYNFIKYASESAAAIRELKLPRRRRRQNRRLKSDFSVYAGNFSAKILSLCFMQANSPGAEFLRKISKFKKSKRDSSSYVHVVDKT